MESTNAGNDAAMAEFVSREVAADAAVQKIVDDVLTNSIEFN